MQGKGP